MVGSFYVLPVEMTGPLYLHLTVVSPFDFEGVDTAPEAGMKKLPTRGHVLPALPAGGHQALP